MHVSHEQKNKNRAKLISVRSLKLNYSHFIQHGYIISNIQSVGTEFADSFHRLNISFFFITSKYKSKYMFYAGWALDIILGCCQNGHFLSILQCLWFDQ